MNSLINVLFIEDNTDAAQFAIDELKAAPSRTNIHLEWVDTLAKGLRHLTVHQDVGAVLLELFLSDSEGLETLERVLAHAPQVPVVVMTSPANEELGVQALQAGAQDYLIKGEVNGRLLTRAIQYAIQRKQSAQQLAEALDFTEHIVRSSPVGIFTYRLSGECLSVNAAAAQMVGGTAEQLLKQNFHHIESWKRSGLYAMARQTIVSGQQTTADIQVKTSFGRNAWYTTQFALFRSGGEDLLLMMFNDITERKQAEEALRESEENYRQLFESESDAIVLIENETGRILQANNAACRLYGYSQEELLTRKNSDLSAEPEQTKKVTQTTPALNQVITIPLRFHRKKDGTVFPVEITGRFFHHRGRAVHIAAIRDLSERQQAETTILTLQKRFQALIENAPDGIALLGLDGKLRQVTPSTKQILGYTLEEAEGQDPALLTHPEDLPALLGVLNDLIQNPEKVVRTQYRFQHKDGSWRWLESTITNLVSEPSIQSMVFNYRDITEQKESEQALKEKGRLLSEAQRIGRIGSWSYEIAGDTMTFSDEMYHLLDVLPEEFQHNSQEFLALVYPSDRPMAARWMEDLKEGLESKDLNFRLFHKNGELCYLHCTGTVEFGPDARPVRFTGTAQDVTEPRVAEMRIDQQLKRLTALSEIDRAIISSFDQRYILNIILAQVRSQLHVDAADILLLDPEGEALAYAAGAGFRTRLRESARLRLGQSHAGRAAKERRMIRIADLREITNDLDFSQIVIAEGFVSYIAVPLVVKGSVKGVLEVLQRSTLQPYQEWLEFFNTLVGQTTIAIENTDLLESLRVTNRELTQAYDATIEGWSRAMDLRDRETEGHTQRVTRLALELARSMGVDETQLMHIRRGALLHDIGKLGVPDHILFKPDLLTAEERVLIEKHVEYAYDMLAPIPYLKPALNIPYFHHEKWDGTGYPLGLKGDQIPLEARIFALADVWDALLSDRPHRKAWTREQALEYVRAQSGVHFDPRVVEGFLQVLKTLE